MSTRCLFVIHVLVLWVSGRVEAQAPSVPPSSAKTAPTDDEPLPEGAIARLGTQRFCHGAPVASICWSPDGRSLASVGSGNVLVRIWDPFTGHLTHSVKVNHLPSSVQYSPDGKILAIACEHGPVILWDTAKQAIVGQIENAHGRDQGVAFSTDGKLVASCGKDGVLLTSCATLRQERQIDTPWGSTSRFAFSPDSRLLAVGFSDAGFLFDVTTGRVVRPLHISSPSHFSFSPDGSTLASTASHIFGLVLLDVGTGKIKRRIDTPPTHYAFAFSPDGGTLAVGGKDATVRLFDPRSGKELHVMAGHAATVSNVAFSPDGRMLASSSWDGTIRLWDVPLGKPLMQHDGHDDDVTALSVVPGSADILSVSADGRIRQWKGHRLGCEFRGSWATRATSVACSPDGKKFFATRADESCRACDIATGQETVIAKQSAGWRIAVSPNGEFLASSGRDVGVWNLKGSPIRHSLSLQAALILRFAPDGKTLALYHDMAVSFRTVPDGKEIRRTPLEGDVYGNDRQFSADLKLLVGSSEDDYLTIWETNTGKRILAMGEAQWSAAAASFSPDGRLVASSGNETLHIWELATGGEIKSFRGHRGIIGALAWFPDNRRLASGAADTTVLIWDVADSNARDRWRRLDQDGRVRLWHELADKSACRGYQAVWTLVGGGDEAVSFLKDCLRPVPVLSDGDISRLISDLEDRRFPVREEAQQALSRVRRQAEGSLRNILAGQPARETRRRIEELLAEPSDLGIALGMEKRRETRALAALERIATRDARRLLQSLADGARGEWLGEQAAVTLKRLR